MPTPRKPKTNSLPKRPCLRCDKPFQPLARFNRFCTACTIANSKAGKLDSQPVDRSRGWKTGKAGSGQ